MHRSTAKSFVGNDWDVDLDLRKLGGGQELSSFLLQKLG